MGGLLADTEVIERVFAHIDAGTTDLAEDGWREPVGNYASQARFERERRLLRHLPVPFCPSAALPTDGSYLAREAAGTPIVVVRDGATVRAFRNACRHRGMQVANGSGTTRAFTCTYHGWNYGLDGVLKHIPHAHGFPDLDRSCHGLVPVAVEEHHGLVWVTQDEPLGRGALDTGEAPFPDVIDARDVVFDSGETTSDVNWKLNMEAALEGYHIKPTHRDTFYPYGFDNLNVVERFGNDSRVTYPFRRIEKLRAVPPDQRNIDGMVTYVYQLFPNVTVAVLSNHTGVSISEPLSPTRTRFHNWRLHRAGTASGKPTDTGQARRDADFVSDTGGKEDAAVVRAIQAGLGSGANQHFTYGRFEGAIVHFHRTLTDHLERLGNHLP